MVTLVALALTAQLQDIEPDARYMLAGVYIAASRAEDPEALGGFGTSHRFHTPVKAEYLGNSLNAKLEIGKDGLNLHVSNGGKTEAWLHAADSNILAHLEAKDKSGAWKPIEYKHWYWCGNSYHRLHLPPGEGWAFSVPMPKGDFNTTVRWKYYGGEQPMFSNEVQFSLPATRFQLMPEVAREAVIDTQYGPPTIKSRGG